MTKTLFSDRVRELANIPLLYLKTQKTGKIKHSATLIPSRPLFTSTCICLYCHSTPSTLAFKSFIVDLFVFCGKWAWAKKISGPTELRLCTVFFFFLFSFLWNYCHLDCLFLFILLVKLLSFRYKYTDKVHFVFKPKK